MTEIRLRPSVPRAHVLAARALPFEKGTEIQKVQAEDLVLRRSRAPPFWQPDMLAICPLFRLTSR